MKLFRAEGVLDPEHLQQVVLAIAGAGSVGGDILANFPYQIGKYILADPDPLGPENIERHILGRTWVGKPKVAGLRRYLMNKGVRANTIVTWQGKAEEILDANPDITHLVIAIDDPVSRRDLHNWVAHHPQVSSLTIGVYPKGTGGHVIIIPAGSEPCGYCGELMMGFDDAFLAYQERNKVHDYGLTLNQVMNPEAPKAVPALHQAVEAISNMAAGVLIDMINGVDIEPQVMIRGNQWESVLRLPRGEKTNAVGRWILAQTEMGLVPQVRMELDKDDPHYMFLQIHQTVLSLALKRQKDCSYHAASSNLNDI